MSDAGITTSEEISQEDNSIRSGEEMGKCLAKPAGAASNDGTSYQWEQHMLNDTVMKTGQVAKSAIISFNNAALRAVSPSDFSPDRKVLKHIVAALKGNVDDLAGSGINLKSGSRMSTPGKIDPGKAIYGSDGHGGGCTIMKAKECVLIVIYEGNPASAARLASEVTEYMESEGY